MLCIIVWFFFQNWAIIITGCFGDELIYCIMQTIFASTENSEFAAVHFSYVELITLLLQHYVS